MKKMKLFPKTFLYTLILLCIMNLIIHLSIYVFYPIFYLNKVNRQLDEKMHALSESLTGAVTDDASDILDSFARKNGVNITTRANGVIMTYQGLPIQLKLPFEDEQAFFLEGNAEVESISFVSGSALLADGTYLELQMLASTQPVKEATGIISFLLPYTLGIAISFSVLFAYFYSKKITGPILEMLKITSDMKNLQPEAYFHIENEDEIGILAEQINQVYAHLLQTIDCLDKEKTHIAHLEKSKVAFLRCASHELKTPLSGLRILLENMLYNVGKYKDHTKYLETAIGNVDCLSSMVQEILDSSRIQGMAPEAGSTALIIKKEIEDVLKDYTLLAAAKSLEISVNIDASLQMSMNRELFQKVWSNLIANAVRYTDMCGRVTISADGNALTIRNTCQPLSDEQLSHIFEAFYRPDFSRSTERGGSGLGLYIVKEILSACRLPCSFDACDDGMCFRMGMNEVIS